MPYHKSRSTIDLRKYQHEKMEELAKTIPHMTDEQVCDLITGLTFYSYHRPKGQTREELVLVWATTYAKRLID